MQDDNLTCDAELEQLIQSFQKQSKFGKSSFLRIIRGLFVATANFVAEPAVQKNTRGRLKNTDKQHKTNPAKPSKFVPQTQQPQPQPHRYSYYNDYKFDLNHSPSRYNSYVDPEPSRHSSYINSEATRYSTYVDPEPSKHSSYINSEPTRYSTYVVPGPPMYNLYTGSEPPIYNSSEPPMHNSYVEPEPPRIPDPLIKAISRKYQPYVKHVQNVVGDGNYGFRVVAVWLGLDESYWPHIRRHLLNEIEARKSDYENVFGEEPLGVLQGSIDFFGSGVAPWTKWMIMSETAAVIASCYNVIVHFISERENITWLPLWSSPPENPQNVTWVIGHVHGNHYVKVDLEGNYPLANIYPSWYRYKRDCAAAWENLYLSRV